MCAHTERVPYVSTSDLQETSTRFARFPGERLILPDLDRLGFGPTLPYR